MKDYQDEWDEFYSSSPNFALGIVKTLKEQEDKVVEGLLSSEFNDPIYQNTVNKVKDLLLNTEDAKKILDLKYKDFISAIQYVSYLSRDYFVGINYNKETSIGEMFFYDRNIRKSDEDNVKEMQNKILLLPKTIADSSNSINDMFIKTFDYIGERYLNIIGSNSASERYALRAYFNSISKQSNRSDCTEKEIEMISKVEDREDCYEVLEHGITYVHKQRVILENINLRKQQYNDIVDVIETDLENILKTDPNKLSLKKDTYIELYSALCKMITNGFINIKTYRINYNNLSSIVDFEDNNRIHLSYFIELLENLPKESKFFVFDVLFQEEETLNMFINKIKGIDFRVKEIFSFLNDLLLYINDKNIRNDLVVVSLMNNWSYHHVSAELRDMTKDVFNGLLDYTKRFDLSHMKEFFDKESFALLNGLMRINNGSFHTDRDIILSEHHLHIPLWDVYKDTESFFSTSRVYWSYEKDGDLIISIDSIDQNTLKEIGVNEFNRIFLDFSIEAFGDNKHAKEQLIELNALCRELSLSKKFNINKNREDKLEIKKKKI